MENMEPYLSMCAVCCVLCAVACGVLCVRCARCCILIHRCDSPSPPPSSLFPSLLPLPLPLLLPQVRESALDIVTLLVARGAHMHTTAQSEMAAIDEYMKTPFSYAIESLEGADFRSQVRL